MLEVRSRRCRALIVGLNEFTAFNTGETRVRPAPFHSFVSQSQRILDVNSSPLQFAVCRFGHYYLLGIYCGSTIYSSPVVPEETPPGSTYRRLYAAEPFAIENTHRRLLHVGGDSLSFLWLCQVFFKLSLGAGSLVGNNHRAVRRRRIWQRLAACLASPLS